LGAQKRERTTDATTIVGQALFVVVLVGLVSFLMVSDITTPEWYFFLHR
jgi:hypothetical protein